ncbi:MAG: response regulator transcription factor [Eubacterium sp.]|nr:response regulator transcription factor [Eubacterium sp.]
MSKILIVEDDEKFNQIVCTFLKKHNYQAEGCLHPVQAFDLLCQKHYDLIISDIMMPQINGIDFAQAVRQTNASIPILFVSALDDLSTKQKGFRAGIDDYMVKPIDLEELVLRIQALLRRTQLNNANELRIGNLVLKQDEMSAFVDGEEIPIMPREFNILYKMLSYPKKIFTRSDLLEDYWAMSNDSSLRSVDVYITKLRKKFAHCDSFELVTVHGFGYKAVVKDA